MLHGVTVAPYTSLSPDRASSQTTVLPESEGST
jgi:hypothetical protein